MNIYQIRSVAQSCPTLCDPMNCSKPGLPVHHQLPEFTETHVHGVSDAIQPSHPLSSPSPLAPNPSQHQSALCGTQILTVLEVRSSKWTQCTKIKVSEALGRICFPDFSSFQRLWHSLAQGPFRQSQQSHHSNLCFCCHIFPDSSDSLFHLSETLMITLGQLYKPEFSYLSGLHHIYRVPLPCGETFTGSRD